VLPPGEWTHGIFPAPMQHRPSVPEDLIYSTFILVGSGKDSLSFISFFFGGDAVQKRMSLHCFKSDQDEICYDCSLSKYSSTDRVRFLIWRHTFKMTTTRTTPPAGCPLFAFDLDLSRVLTKFILPTPVGLNMFSYSLVLFSIGTLDLAPPNLPPPEFICAAASQIYHGLPACQPDLTSASRKSDSGMAEGSIIKQLTIVLYAYLLHCYTVLTHRWLHFNKYLSSSHLISTQLNSSLLKHGSRMAKRDTGR